MSRAAMLRPKPIAWLRSRPSAADGLLAALVTSIALAIHIARPADVDQVFGDPTWWRALLVIVCTAPIMFRRRWPISTFFVVFVVQIIAELVHALGSGWIGVLIAVYSVAAHTAGRRRTWTMTISGVCLTIFILAGIGASEASIWDLIGTGVTFITAFVIGDNLRQRRERIVSLAERADRAEREQELLADRRVLEERTRIARELHDVVAHSVSVMTIQAAAARRQLARNPDQAAEMLEQLESTGRTAMDEMRQILGVLRTPDADDDLTPQPSLLSLQALIEADSSLPVEVDRDGDLSTIPASTQLAAYRVVQEALTNVRKHAGRARVVKVSVRATVSELHVEVTDDGRGASAARNDQGFGLIGMSERVAIANGRLDTGPRPGGGWRVAAVFSLNDSLHLNDSFDLNSFHLNDGRAR